MFNERIEELLQDLAPKVWNHLTPFEQELAVALYDAALKGLLNLKPFAIFYEIYEHVDFYFTAAADMAELESDQPMLDNLEIALGLLETTLQPV